MCVNSTQAESLPFSAWKGSNLNNLPSSNRLSLQSEVKVTQSCPTLCDSMDYTVHGILRARILEWVAFPFSRGSSQPRDWTQVSHIAGRIFTSWATREAQKMVLYQELRINLYCWLSAAEVGSAYSWILYIVFIAISMVAVSVNPL